VAGLAVACRTIQLVDARDGGPRPATDVIDPALLPAAEAIGPTLEGKTERQKNPHPVYSLAWPSWIVARLGGWNCYYKPPGPKTMRAGWAQFETMAAGFVVATTPRPSQMSESRSRACLVHFAGIGASVGPAASMQRWRSRSAGRRWWLGMPKPVRIFGGMLLPGHSDFSRLSVAGMSSGQADGIF
jgi:hypothetical protein